MACKSKNGNSSDGLTARMEVRLHPGSKARILSQAKKAGLTGSEYLRQVGEDGQIIINETTGVRYADFNQFSKYGYNIMYLLKEYRTHGHPPPGNLEALFADHQKFLKKLLDDAEM